MKASSTATWSTKYTSSLLKRKLKKYQILVLLLAICGLILGNFAKAGDGPQRPVPFHDRYQRLTSSGSFNGMLNSIPLPTLSYAGVKSSYLTGQAITALNPTVTGTPLIGNGSFSNTINTVGSGFNHPTGVAMDAAGNLYVADESNNSVKQIPAGHLTDGTPPVIVGSGFSYPYCVAVDAAGNVYVADYGNNAIKKLPAGHLTDGTSPITIGNGFDSPTSLAVDATGNVYVADNSSKAKQIPAGHLTDGTPPVTIGSWLAHPYGVAVDAAGNVYVSDFGNNTVNQIPAGHLTDGTSITIGSGFNFPFGVNVDSAGNVYVADYGNNAVKKIPAGHLTDGTAPIPIGSGFFEPYGVTLDAAGNVYVAEYDNNVLKQVRSNNYSISPALPAGLSIDATTGVISGTPTTATPATSYTITTQNAGGATTATITFATLMQPPTVNYAGVKAAYLTGQAITLNPTVTGTPLIGNGNFSNTVNNLGKGFKYPTGVAVDAAGNVYVADEGNDAVKMIPAGRSAPVAIGLGFSGPSGVAMDTAGNVYVADEGNNAVKMIPAGHLTDGTTPITIGKGFHGPAGVAVDAAGNVYVAEYSGNSVKQIPAGHLTDGTTPITIGLGFKNPYAVAVDAAGNLYVADLGNSAVKQIPAGHFTDGTTPISIGSGFNKPNGVAVDPAGNLYVADYGNNAVEKIPAGHLTDGTTLTTIGSGFYAPYGVAVDAAGNLYVADQGNNAVKQLIANIYSINAALPGSLRMDSKTGVISGTPTTATPVTSYTITTQNAGGATTATISFATITPLPTLSYVGVKAGYLTGHAITALKSTVTGTPLIGNGSFSNTIATLGSGFQSPVGVALDAAGNVYVADQRSNAVQVIPAGHLTDDTSPYTLGSGAFNIPYSVAVDTAGNVYVSNLGDNSVKEISSDGMVITIGSAIGSSFNNPTSVAVDAAGNLYVADNGNNAVKEIPAGHLTDGSTPFTIGSGFNHPNGVAVDAAGNVYVADYGNNVVKEISAVHLTDGTSPTTIGSGFNHPWGVAVDAIGNVYVGDLDGVKEILAGHFTDGTTPASIGSGFNQPHGVAVDTAGNVYVADFDNSAVKELKTIIYSISPALPAGLSIDASTGVISGTPTTAIPATSYTITTQNGGGATTATITFATTPPPTLNYAGVNASYLTGQAITALNPTVTGTPLIGNGSFNKTIRTLGSGFVSPTGVALDAAGNIYVPDFNKSAVFEIPAGHLTDGTTPTIIGSGFKNPYAVAVDATGNVYVADYGNNAIKKIPAGHLTDGTIPITIGKGFDSPRGLAMDAAGNVYVADYGNNAVKKIPAGHLTDGTTPTTIGSGFYFPAGVAVDAAGNVYVADQGNNAVEKIPAGHLTDGTTPTSIGSGFDQPNGVAVDGAGNVYVADQGNNLVKQIPAGHLTDGTTPTTLGSGFVSPFGVAVDATGSIYIADLTAVKQLMATIYSVSPALPAGLKIDAITGVISGTPTTATPATNYTITTQNAGGATTATISFATVMPPPPTLSYAGVNASYLTGRAITALKPTVTGTPLIGNGSFSNTITTIGSGFNSPTGVAVDAAGNVYVADLNGAEEIPVGHLTDGTAPATLGSGFNFPFGVGVDAAGNVYVADYNGGVKEIPSAHLTDGTAPSSIGSGFTHPTAVVVDTAGNVYVADYGSNMVKEIPAGHLTDGTPPVTIGSGFTHPYSVAVDAAGNVYVADYGNNAVKQITAGHLTDGTTPITIGSGFFRPTSVAVDAAGNVYVVDNAGRVKQIPAGHLTDGTSPVTFGSGFNQPFGVALDTAGNVYVADYGNSAMKELKTIIYSISPSLPAGLSIDAITGVISGTPTTITPATSYTITTQNVVGTTTATITFATLIPPPTLNYAGVNASYITGTAITSLIPTVTGTPLIGNGSFSNTIATLGSGFKDPYSVVVDAAGNVYVADYGHNAVKKIPAGHLTDGTTPTTIGSGFSNPSAVAVDAAGNIYVADYANSVVQEVPAGHLTDGTTPITLGSGFTHPTGVAVDAAGNVYVADYGNSAVKEMSASHLTDGTTPITIGSGFSYPWGVALDAAGNVYVADQGNNLVKEILAAHLTDGTIPTNIGAGFSYPFGVAVDAAGNIYIANNGNSVVQEIRAGHLTDGTTPTTIGSGFKNPFGVALDGAGNVYVADYGNSAVKELKATIYSISPSLPAGLNIDSTTGVVSGTPTTATPTTSYTITTQNTMGPTTATITFATLSPQLMLSSASVCSGINSTTLTLSGYAGTIQWQSSTDNITFNDITGETGATYTASNLTATTWYQAVINSDGTGTTTESVAVTVNESPSLSTDLPTTSYTFTVNKSAPVLSVVATGTNLIYQWYSTTSNSNLDGAAITNATTATYTPVVTTAGTSYYYVIVSGDCGSRTSSIATVIVNAVEMPAVAGTINGEATVCSGTNSTMLTLGGYTGTIQWQSSTDNETFNDIGSASSANYTATDLSATTWYRAFVTSGNTSATSSIVAVTVNPITAITTDVSSPVAVCAGGIAPDLTVIASGSGTPHYQWYINTTNSNTGGSTIGTDASAYTPDVSTTGTYYYYVIVSGDCGTKTSAVATVLVNPNIAITKDVSSPSAVCAGGTATDLSVTASGTGTLHYQWYINTANSNSGGSTIGTDASTYTPDISTAGTCYYYVIISDDCGTKTSAVATVVVNPNTDISTDVTTTPYSIDINGTAPVLNVIADGSNLSYQWYSNTSNSSSSGSLINGATTATYTPAVNAAGTSYYYIVVNGDCGSKTSSVATVTVNATPVAGIISGAASVCAPANSTTLTLSSYTGTIQWQSSIDNITFNDIASATGATYTASDLIATTWYRAVVTSRNTSATSSSEAVMVNPNTAIITDVSSPSAVSAGGTTIDLSVTATGTGTLHYQWYSNTTDSNIGGSTIGTDASTYTPDVSTAGTYHYYVIVSSDCGTKTSAVATVVVNPNTSILTDLTTTAYSIDINGKAPVLSVVANGNDLSYQWYSNTSNSNSNGSLIIGATTATYSPLLTTTGTSYYYVVVKGDFGSKTSSVATIIVNAAPAVAGTINGEAAVCSGTNSTMLTLGAYTGAIQWQSSTDNATFNDITSASGATYTASNLSATTWYRAVVTSGSTSATSPNIAVTVNPNTAINTDVSNPDPVCAGATAPKLSVTATGTGTLHYQWYSNTTNKNSGGSAIGTDASTYTPDVSATGTYYYYVIVSTDCGTLTSAVATVVVNPKTTITTNVTTTAYSININGTAPVLSVVAAGSNLSYQWYSNTSNSSNNGSLINGATTATYTPSVTTAGTSYYYVVVKGDCGSKTSSIATVTVKAAAVAGMISGAASVCSGTNSTTLTLNGYTGTIQWQSSTDNATFKNISGATRSTYTASNLVATTWYRAVVANSSTSATSSSVMVTVNPNTAIKTNVTTTAYSININGTAPVLSVFAAGSNLSYQWYSNTSNSTNNGSLIKGTSTATYTPPVTTAGTSYYYVVVMGDCGSKTSSIATVTVKATAVAGIISGAASVCSGTNSTTLTLNGYTGTIQWQSSTDNATFKNISGATRSTYTASNLVATTWYRAVVANGGATATSPAAAVTISAPSINVTSSNPHLYFGAPGDQTSTITASATGGSAPYTITFSCSRALISNYINNAGDEIWKATGSTKTSANPPSVFTGVADKGSASINVALLADADITATVTDAKGCTQIAKTIHVIAEDARCFAGKSQNAKVSMCHVTGSKNNPWVQICVDANAVQSHLNQGDFLGSCTVNTRQMNLNTTNAAEMVAGLAQKEEVLGKLSVTVMPNPTSYYFTLGFKSLNKEKIKVTVTDILGRVIEQRTDIPANSTIQLAGHYHPGVYIAEFLQGNDKVTIQLIKEGK